MDPALQSLVSRLDQFPEQFRELREGVQEALLVADRDPELVAATPTGAAGVISAKVIA
jgi:hypothetical protein